MCLLMCSSVDKHGGDSGTYCVLVKGFGASPSRCQLEHCSVRFKWYIALKGNGTSVLLYAEHSVLRKCNVDFLLTSIVVMVNILFEAHSTVKAYEALPPLKSLIYVKRILFLVSNV